MGGGITVTDDIVIRLRNRRGTIPALCDAAADEIERLRKEVEVWRKIAHTEHSAWSQCPSDCLCLSNDFRKAVRGE